jgi:transposase-like protein
MSGLRRPSDPLLVSAGELISSVTDAVVDEVKAWQSRPLDTLYPIVYLP